MRMDADLIVLYREFNVITTIVNGEIAYKRDNLIEKQ